MPDLVMLPNRDLWRGHNYKARVDTSNVEIKNEPRPFSRLDEILATQMRLANGHSELTCLWCGTQCGVKEMREHLKAQHASVVNPPTDAELMAAQQKITAESTAPAKEE